MSGTNPGEICFILKGYPRISETFISNEILGLEQLGFKIRIIAMRHPRESFSHGHIKQIQAKVDYLPSSMLPNIRLLLRHNLALAFKHPRLYGKGLKLALVRWWRTKKSATFKHLLQAGYLVNHLLPQSQITHFHAHFAHSPTSVALFSSILAGLPFSFFAHAKDIYTQDPKQLTEKIAMAAFVATCTQYNQKHLQALAPQASIDCVYHGINLDFFAQPAPVKQPVPTFSILTVARHTHKKGLDLVIRAMAILRDDGVDFHHTIIGEGDLKDEMAALIASLRLDDHITLAGTLAHEDVIQYYAKADVFILGCRISDDGDRDGIPNVMAEAMAMGVPVVAPHTSGIPELLIQGETGILVPSESPQALASAAQQLLFDSELRHRMIPMARKKVEECFDNKKLIHDLAKVYRVGMARK